jgi:hypothetical protein
MHCLDCMTAAGGDAPFGTEPVVALCAYCGAAVCYQHALTTRVDPPRIGLIPQTRLGTRRILCAECAGAAVTSTPRPRVGAAMR